MERKSFIRLLMLLACLAGAPQTSLPAHGAEPVKIGILASPSKPQALAQWQPLTVILKEAMPERDFVVVALNLPELDQAVAARQLDFVLTNSGHYVLLRNRNGLSSPLATLATDVAGHSLTVYGGVIFCRAGQTKINTLSDIKGKTVAAVDSKSQGGYQMQAYELSRAGVRLPQDVKLITTGLPMGQVVAEVLAGRAEVGFVRSGVLDGMVRAGKLDITQLKIINRQDLPDFPLQVSTRLYPEWPFAAMPHIDEKLARQVVTTLFELDENKAATRAMGIHGFVVPVDYSAVEEVLRELRLPPFEVAPRFTLQDVWARYRWQTMGGALAGGVILLLGVAVMLMYRRLAANHQVVLLQRHKLQESEEKFRALVESTCDWIWEVDRNGRYTYVSPRVEALLGYKPEEVLGRSPFDFMPPEEGQRVGKTFGEIIGNRAPLVAQENTNIHKDGRLVILETSGVPFFDDNGEFAGYRGIDRDITERKQTVAAVERLRHEMAMILEAAGEGICTFDVNGNHVLVNPSAARMFGYEAVEMIGRHSHSLWHYAKADGTPYPEEECPIYTAMRDGVTKCNESELFWRKDGTGFPVEYVISPIQSNGVLTGGVVVFHDVTERKQVEEKIRKLNDELEEKVQERTQQLLAAQEELLRTEKLAMLGQVAGSVGHELRNPLGVMNNAVYFLQTVLAESDDSVKEYLGIIGDEITRSEHIVEELLAAVRTRPPDLAAHGVAELVGQILRQCLVPDAVTVTLDISETLPPLRVDALQMQQVLRNLIDNGVEAMPEGGTLALRAVENRPDGTVCLSVRDSGSGMPPEVLAQLFQPLFTTKARGIGLGLVVAKNLIQANGGSIKVESEVGKGSVFFVTLPAANIAEITA